MPRSRVPSTALVSLLTATLLASSAVAQPVVSGPPPEMKGWRAVTVVEGLRHPWGIAWLPDGRALITCREGTLHLLEGTEVRRVEVEGLPKLMASGQGGLLDIALHPKKPELVYMTASTGTKEANRTTLVRGVWRGERLTGVTTLFSVTPDKSGGQHFGSRLLWLPDGTLLMSVGDGGNPPQRVGGMLAREQAQNLGSHLGAVLRLTEEGRPAPDNPRLEGPNARPEIWTYGHRNIQGLTLDDRGRVFANEHGPYGGDELNLLEAGRNYGWPLQSHGRDYRTREPVGRPSVPGMVDPLVVWTPSPAPSGLVYYTGARAPAWRGSLFSGGLAGEDIRRVVLDPSGKVTTHERLSIGRRVRDVRQGPDGFLYALTDERNGRLLRIEPE